tara:strand:- start:30 stop:1115 length:1086 start_codon:yes stop_codon:yes gene_type:complete
MTYLIGGDCLEHLETFEPNSIDLIFCDLPYGQTSCKWDCPIDLDILWKHFMRIKKLKTPIIMTCTTKFGVNLINSAPKKCPFRYDLVWCKSSPCGFLSAKKMPMRKHEMIYVFYEKLPFYDLSSHKHKFIKEGASSKGDKGNECYGKFSYFNNGEKGYEPKLPTSLIKEDLDEKYKNKGGLYSKVSRNGLLKAEPHYEPPLPTSLLKEDSEYSGTINTLYSNNVNVPSYVNKRDKKTGYSAYEPPLPTSLVKEDDKMNTLYGEVNIKKLDIERKDRTSAYNPPLPDSLLEIKSTRGKHSTEKPVELMKWILKYYSKEGDLVLDPTMGSGSMGVACEEMKRNFIGIEKDEEIFGVAWERLNG